MTDASFAEMRLDEVKARLREVELELAGVERKLDLSERKRGYITGLACALANLIADPMAKTDAVMVFDGQAATDLAYYANCSSLVDGAEWLQGQPEARQYWIKEVVERTLARFRKK